jgi:hypothetical protein
MRSKRRHALEMPDDLASLSCGMPEDFACWPGLPALKDSSWRGENK